MPSASQHTSTHDAINTFPSKPYNSDQQRSEITSITIPEGVTHIAYGAFSRCFSLTSITIPESVTHIGKCAFSWCSSLTAITIPGSVTHISDWAFSVCSSLTAITIPESVTHIGECAFYDCSSLTAITIPGSVTHIGNEAFSRCYSLTSITIPERVTHIGNAAFSYCRNLTSITIPPGVTDIPPRAFEHCNNLQSIILPNHFFVNGAPVFEGLNPDTRIINIDQINALNLSGNYTGNYTIEQKWMICQILHSTPTTKQFYEISQFISVDDFDSIIRSIAPHVPEPILNTYDKINAFLISTQDITKSLFSHLTVEDLTQMLPACKENPMTSVSFFQGYKNQPQRARWSIWRSIWSPLQLVPSKFQAIKNRIPVDFIDRVNPFSSTRLFHRTNPRLQLSDNAQNPHTGAQLSSQAESPQEEQKGSTP